AVCDLSAGPQCRPGRGGRGCGPGFPGDGWGSCGIFGHRPGPGGDQQWLAATLAPPAARGGAVRTLARDISVTVLMAILGVLMVVVALDVMAAIIDEVGDIRGDYTFAEVLVYVATTLPGRVYQNLPFSALIGCLVGLGLLASNSELAVMRAAGISLLQIVAVVLRPVLLLIVVAGVLGEYAVPYTDQYAEGRRAMLLGKQDRLATSGLWNREDNEFIHVGVVFPNGELVGV